MDTNRIDTMLNRQKRNLITDAFCALIVVAGLLMYIFSLGSSRAVATPLPASVPAQQPAMSVHADDVHADSADCMPETGIRQC